MQLGIILNSARHDVADRYAGSVLGGAWSFILPLVQTLIFTMIFSEFVGAPAFSNFSCRVVVAADLTRLWLSLSASDDVASSSVRTFDVTADGRARR